MIDRMTRAVQMRTDLYEEAEATPALDQEAWQVVLLVGAAYAVGQLLLYLMQGRIGAAVVQAIVVGGMSIAAWWLWTYVVTIVGTKMFNGTSDIGEVRRTLAYAYTPSLAAAFAFVPTLGPLLGFVGSIWTLVLGVVAIRQAMDFDTGRAIGTVVIAAIAASIVVFVVVAILTALLLAPLGLAAMMMP